MSNRIQASREMPVARVVKVPMWARAREYTDEVLRFWVATMRNDTCSEPVRMKASENLMDRAWGKSPVVIVGDEDRPISVDVRAIDASVIGQLESALMLALGDAITHAPGRDRSLLDITPTSAAYDAPLKSSPHKGLSQPGHLVPADMQTGLCVVPSANESCATGDNALNTPLDASGSHVAGLTRGGEGDDADSAGPV